MQPWTFEQMPREAVFIPGGCPHQVGGRRLQHARAARRGRGPAAWGAAGTAAHAGRTPASESARAGAPARRAPPGRNGPHRTCSTSRAPLPRQVRNLRPCLKVAVDFLTPSSLGEADVMRGRLRGAVSARAPRAPPAPGAPSPPGCGGRGRRAPAPPGRPWPVAALV